MCLSVHEYKFQLKQKKFVLERKYTHTVEREDKYQGGNNIQSSADHNLWNMLIALGNIALASCYSQIAVDIQVCMHNK